jgi:hypothetical protein
MKHQITKRRGSNVIKNKRGVSVVISTVIITTTILVMVLITVATANNVLSTSLAENEFVAAQQFMLTTGLQIDNVAWTVGRTQTINYYSNFGHVRFQTVALTYSVQMHSNVTGEWELVFPSNITTGMVLFNMPLTAYNLYNGKFERLLPTILKFQNGTTVPPDQNGPFLQNGTTAPVSHVFIHELLPANNESYLRIAAVPSIRVLNSSIVSPTQSTCYYKFFLPTLERSSENPLLTQSITMVGGQVTKVIRKDIDQVNITVSFPSGFGQDFFKFDGLVTSDGIVETVALPPDSVVEFYIGKVIVSQGVA